MVSSLVAIDDRFLGLSGRLKGADFKRRCGLCRCFHRDGFARLERAGSCQQATRDRVSQAVAHGTRRTTARRCRVQSQQYRRRDYPNNGERHLREGSSGVSGRNGHRRGDDVGGELWLIRNKRPSKSAPTGRGADGLLLIGIARPEETYHFRQRNVPYVIAWNFRQDTDNVYAGFDNRQAAMDLTIW